MLGSRKARIGSLREIRRMHVSMAKVHYNVIDRSLVA